MYYKRASLLSLPRYHQVFMLVQTTLFLEVPKNLGCVGSHHYSETTETEANSSGSLQISWVVGCSVHLSLPWEKLGPGVFQLLALCWVRDSGLGEIHSNCHLCFYRLQATIIFHIILAFSDRLDGSQFCG